MPSRWPHPIAKKTSRQKEGRLATSLSFSPEIKPLNALLFRFHNTAPPKNISNTLGHFSIIIIPPTLPPAPAAPPTISIILPITITIIIPRLRTPPTTRANMATTPPLLPNVRVRIAQEALDFIFDIIQQAAATPPLVMAASARRSAVITTTA